MHDTPLLRAVAILLALGASPAVADRTIPRDPGGSVVLRILEIAGLEASGQPKRVSGECFSACTLYLGLSTACFEPGAVLGFHSPLLPGGRAMTDRQFEATTRAMASYYPTRLRHWWMTTGRYSRQIIRIPARRLIHRGEARACG